MERRILDLVTIIAIDSLAFIVAFAPQFTLIYTILLTISISFMQLITKHYAVLRSAGIDFIDTTIIRPDMTEIKIMMGILNPHEIPRQKNADPKKLSLFHAIHDKLEQETESGLDKKRMKKKTKSQKKQPARAVVGSAPSIPDMEGEEIEEGVPDA